MKRNVATTAGGLLIASAALTVGAVPANAAFSPTMNAADGISTLESEGYNVEINWGGGRTDQNLSLCRISGVDGMRGSGAVIPGTSVYVTVVC